MGSKHMKKKKEHPKKTNVTIESLDYLMNYFHREDNSDVRRGSCIPSNYYIADNSHKTNDI
jgi:hypothetical protein